jgi:hypothetical protein
VTGAATIDAASISFDATTASDFTVTGAGQDLTIFADGGSLVLESNEAVVNAVSLSASNAAGGMVINSGTGGTTITCTAGTIDLNATTGLLTATPATDTQAAAAVTINANVGYATFTGLTTAAAAAEVLTVTNAICTATSAILCTLSNFGANDAQMTVTRVVPAAGSFTVTATNYGTQALNGNLVLTFWIIAS